jgi:hypothetical protein
MLKCTRFLQFEIMQLYPDRLCGVLYPLPSLPPRGKEWFSLSPWGKLKGGKIQKRNE